jgi:hypothetical protein
MKHLASKLTYADVMATVAVFLVLAGGTAYAATTLSKNSVGTKQIKNNAVTTAKIKNGAVTGSKIRLSSLGAVPDAGNATHADSATNATHAVNADNAGHAGAADSATNAAKLNGQEAATYLGRATQALAFLPAANLANNVLTNLTPGGQLSITVPNGVQSVMAHGTVSYGEPSAPMLTDLWIAESPNTCATITAGLGWENRAFGSFGTANPRDQLTQTILFPATTGVHTYQLCGAGSGGTMEAFLRELTLQTVAGGPTG